MAEPVPDAAPAPAKPGKKQYQRIDPPTMETMVQEEFMNNCATRTVLSGVMGLGLGVLFGVFMGSMDGAVSIFRSFKRYLTLSFFRGGGRRLAVGCRPQIHMNRVETPVGLIQ